MCKKYVYFFNCVVQGDPEELSHKKSHIIDHARNVNPCDDWHETKVCKEGLTRVDVQGWGNCPKCGKLKWPDYLRYQQNGDQVYQGERSLKGVRAEPYEKGSRESSTHPVGGTYNPKGVSYYLTDDSEDQEGGSAFTSWPSTDDEASQPKPTFTSEPRSTSSLRPSSAHRPAKQLSRESSSGQVVRGAPSVGSELRDSPSTQLRDASKVRLEQSYASASAAATSETGKRASTPQSEQGRGRSRSRTPDVIGGYTELSSEDAENRTFRPPSPEMERWVLHGRSPPPGPQAFAERGGYYSRKTGEPEKQKFVSKQERTRSEIRRIRFAKAKQNA